jgi:LysM repeat protein
MKKYLDVLIFILGSLTALLVLRPFLIPAPQLKDVLPPGKLADPDSHNIEVKDNKVHYIIAGCSEPVFLLLHGFASNLFAWHEIMPALAKDGAVIANGRPAFGFTEGPLTWKGENQFGVQAQVDLALELMDKQGVSKAILVGNSAGRTKFSTEATVGMWQGDDPHSSTLLGLSYQYVGAGVAEKINFVYFTLDTAYMAVEQASNSPTPTLQGTPGAGIPTTAITYVVPVRKATPNADGSIIHVVEYGQTLYGIADAYKVTVDQLITLNKLTGTTIYVGDKLTIQAAFTPTATGQPALSPPARTRSNNPTLTPRPHTTTPSPINPTTVIPTPTRTPIPTVLSGIGKDPLLLLIIIIASAGLFMMVAGSLLRRTNS